MTDRTELRSWLGGMQSLAECEGIYDGNASVCSIVARVLPLFDQLDAAEAALARVRELHASSGTAESQGYNAEGEYGFIAPYCIGCEASDEYATAWPCPTIRALGGAEC